MTLDQLCCSIESAKKLRELGFNKKSYAYYCVGEIPMNPCILVRDHDEIINYKTNIPAYTAAELLEVLPWKFRAKTEGHRDRPYCLEIEKTEYDFWVKYKDLIKPTEIPEIVFIGNQNLAEACALCLIHLLENKLVSLEEINK